jgi:hypothetical protein
MEEAICQVRRGTIEMIMMMMMKMMLMRARTNKRTTFCFAVCYVICVRSRLPLRVVNVLSSLDIINNVNVNTTID